MLKFIEFENSRVAPIGHILFAYADFPIELKTAIIADVEATRASELNSAQHA